MRMKLLPARDQMNGKAWVAFDTKEIAENAVEEVGGETGDFEFMGSACRIRMVDYELVLKRKERYQEKQRTIYVGNLNFRMEDW